MKTIDETAKYRELIEKQYQRAPRKYRVREPKFWDTGMIIASVMIVLTGILIVVGSM